MLRDKALIPLSHQHQHALALCVKIDRALKAAKADIRHWQEEIARQFESEIRYHFEGEEKVLFPAAARQPALAPLVQELLAEHKLLRQYAQRAGAGKLRAAGLQDFVTTLSSHVRKEERRLFEQMQKLLSQDELHRLGTALDEYFRSSGLPGASCSLR